MTVVERLTKLQKEYFKQSGDLYENIEQLGDVLYKLMLNDLIEVYKQESKLLLDEAKIGYASTKYEIAQKRAFETPGHRFLCFGRNEPAKLINREVAVVYDEQYNKRVDAVELREAALDIEDAKSQEREQQRRENERKAKEQLKQAIADADVNGRVDEEPQEPAGTPENAPTQDKPGTTDEPQEPAGTLENAQDVNQDEPAPSSPLIAELPQSGTDKKKNNSKR